MLTDDLGAAVELSGPPRRVVSLVPSLTEAVALSAPGVLVGATDYCVHPADLDVARVGGSKYPSVDAVLAAKPDLVLANAEENRPEDVAALREACVPVWVTEAAADVPIGLASVRRMLTGPLGLRLPAWLGEAERVWAVGAPAMTPVVATAIVAVWRRPWVLVGGRTFAGDVLRRLGVANAYEGHADRYPRPPLDELSGLLADGGADLVVLPDEPYLFTADDGPEAFPGTRCALIDGRLLTWCGPSLVEAHTRLTEQLALGR